MMLMKQKQLKYSKFAIRLNQSCTKSAFMNQFALPVEYKMAGRHNKSSFPPRIFTLHSGTHPSFSFN